MYRDTRGGKKLIIDGDMISGEIFPMIVVSNGQRRLVGHMAKVRGKNKPMVGGLVSNGIDSWIAERVDQSDSGYTILLS